MVRAGRSGRRARHYDQNVPTGICTVAAALRTVPARAVRGGLLSEGTATAGRLPPRISACAGGQPGWARACDGLDDRLTVDLGRPGPDLDSGQRRAAARLRGALDMRRIERAARSNLGEALPGGRSQYVP